LVCFIFIFLYIIDFADAPCHGKQYHNLATYPQQIRICNHFDRGTDRYPEGDPYFLKPEEYLDNLAALGVDYYFMQIHSSTIKMTSIFKEKYLGSGESEVLFDCLLI
jgi:hypothetical protein